MRKSVSNFIITDEKGIVIARHTDYSNSSGEVLTEIAGMAGQAADGVRGIATAARRSTYPSPK